MSESEEKQERTERETIYGRTEPVPVEPGGMTALEFYKTWKASDSLLAPQVDWQAKIMAEFAEAYHASESSREIQQLKNDCIRLAQERSALIERAEAAERTVAELGAKVEKIVYYAKRGLTEAYNVECFCQLSTLEV